MATDLRPSAIAGQWYPADPDRLAAGVDAYISAAELPELEGRVVGILTPHAGHRYSGPVAGYAFAALRGLQPELVAVVSPMHYPASPALLTSAHDAYQTPLGTIPVDQEALQALEAHLQVTLGSGLAPVKNDPEHSLEIELPFLQRTFESEFSLLPVMVRDASSHTVHALGDALAEVLGGRKAILVASSDLSHFYPQPLAERLDGEMLRRVETLDPEAVLHAEDEGKGFACGRGALAAVMIAALALGANRGRILRYATSGDITGDYSQVVGYGAAVFYQFSALSDELSATQSE
jgi:AmmeMemoRadiSam system protein B